MDAMGQAEVPLSFCDCCDIIGAGAEEGLVCWAETALLEPSILKILPVPPAPTTAQPVPLAGPAFIFDLQ